jgi:hypothetical protein
MGTVTVHRDRSVIGRARRVTVLLDGEPVGTLRRGRQLSIRVPHGSHQLTARLGSTTSRPLALESEDADTLVAVQTVVPTGHGYHPPEDYLQLRPVTHVAEIRGVTFGEVRRTRPPVGYRRLQGWERPLFAVALVIVIGTQIMGTRTLGQGMYLAISGPAEIVVLVLVVRLFLYRAKK